MKSLLFALLFALIMPCYAGQEALCSAVTTVTTSTGKAEDTTKTFQGKMTVSSGSGSATVGIQGSMDNTFWDTLGTLTLSDTVSDSFTDNASSYAFYRCNVTAISGTGASVTVTVRSRAP